MSSLGEYRFELPCPGMALPLHGTVMALSRHGTNPPQSEEIFIKLLRKPLSSSEFPAILPLEGNLNYN